MAFLACVDSTADQETMLAPPLSFAPHIDSTCADGNKCLQIASSEFCNHLLTCLRWRTVPQHLTNHLRRLTRMKEDGCTIVSGMIRECDRWEICSLICRVALDQRRERIGVCFAYDVADRQASHRLL